MIRVTEIVASAAAGILAAVFTVPACADAPSDSQPDSLSIVTLSATADSEDGSEYYLDANIAVAHQRRLILSLGQLFIKSSETAQSIEPVTALVGLETDFDATIPLGLEYQYWDDQENINVKTLRGTLGYQFDKVDVTFKPQIREFNFIGERVRRESSSEGYTLHLGGQALDNVYLYGEYGKHYYAQSLLNLAQVLLLFDYARLKLVNSVGFSDYIYTLGGSWYFNWGSVSGFWVDSVSALDRTNTYNYGGTAEFDVAQTVSLGMTLGTQSTERDDPDFFYGTLTVSYYW